MKYRGMMMAAFALSVLSDSATDVKRKATFKPDTEGDKQRALERHQQILKQKGVKEFTIDGKKVFARDYANALRKRNNIV